MEGPYRDLGSGFARLTGAEGARRGPSRISCVEDALFELLRNARDAGARRIYVATTLRARRYRVLTVLDDGCGVPQGYEDLIFEPGVTTRHLDPVPDDPASPHGAGLSLYHLRNASLEARLLSSNSPTAIRAVFDTRTLPERSLQSRTRPSRSNIPATCRDFVRRDPSVRLYCSSPARILATLLHSRIIHSDKLAGVERRARDVGLEVSRRTVRRVLAGEIEPARTVKAERDGRSRGGGKGSASGDGGAMLALSEEDGRRIEAILRRAADASYLEIVDFRLESRPGEIFVRARVSEPEEEYE